MTTDPPASTPNPPHGAEITGRADAGSKRVAAGGTEQGIWARWWSGVTAPRRARRRSRMLARHHAATGAKAQAAIAARIRSGDHVGAVPYGYDLHPSTHHGPVAAPRRTLVPDPVTASVVVQIFTWRTEHDLGATMIAAALAADPHRYPSPRRRDGGHRPWTRSVVRHILANPVYLGRPAWGRTHRGRPAPTSTWVLPEHRFHPALINPDTFYLAQQPLHFAPRVAGDTYGDHRRKEARADQTPRREGGAGAPRARPAR